MRLAFEVTGVFHVGDGGSRDDWSDVELHEIAIGYRLSDRERVVEHEIEGVRVQVRVPDAQRWERGLLAEVPSVDTVDRINQRILAALGAEAASYRLSAGFQDTQSEVE